MKAKSGMRERRPPLWMRYDAHKKLSPKTILLKKPQSRYLLDWMASPTCGWANLGHAIVCRKSLGLFRQKGRQKKNLRPDARQPRRFLRSCSQTHSYFKSNLLQAMDELSNSENSKRVTI